jgi:hypothetical protein
MKLVHASDCNFKTVEDDVVIEIPWNPKALASLVAASDRSLHSDHGIVQAGLIIPLAEVGKLVYARPTSSTRFIERRGFVPDFEFSFIDQLLAHVFSSVRRGREVLTDAAYDSRPTSQYRALAGKDTA